MRKVGSPPANWWTVVLFITVLVIAADQISKTWIRTYPQGHLIYKLGFLGITHHSNTGAAFGLFQGQSFALAIIAVISVIALLLLAFWVYRSYPFLLNKLNLVAFSFILGGTVSNLIDRLRFGSVTEFIGVGFWPTFNVADPAITIGVILLVYSILRRVRAEEH